MKRSPEEQKAFLQQKLEQSAFVGYNGLNVPVNVPQTPPPQPVQKQPASEELDSNSKQPEEPEIETTSEEEEETVQPKELSTSASPNPESPNTEEKEEDVTPNQQSEAESTHPQSQKPDLQAQKEKASRLSSNWLKVPVNTPGSPPSPVQRTLSTSGLEHQYQPQIGQRANSVLNGLNQFKAQQLSQDYSVQRQDSSGESPLEEPEEKQPESLHNQQLASSPPDNPEDNTASGSNSTLSNLQFKNNKEQKRPQKLVQSDGAIQAKCSECEKQEEKDESVQTKLTVGEPGDKYEQEADTMAAKVMAMPDSTLSQSVQRQTEADKPPLAKSISSLVQRSASDTSQASPSIENRLASSQGGGNSLPENVRSFMEPRFGADFSAVRVHTDSTAVQMNKELGAQAFAHGSNIYYGAGKSPNVDELTAHELTHTIQQGAAKTLQEKPLTSLRSNKQSIQTKINPAQSANSISTSAVQVQKNSQQQPFNNKDLGTSIQMKCATCAENEQKEEQIQRKSLAENITPKDNKAVQKWGWDDFTNTLGAGAKWAGDTVSSGAQWVGDKVGDAASMGKDAFAALVARVAPGLANLIRQGPVGILSEKIKEGVKGWLSGVMANVDIGSVIAGLKSSFAGVFATIQGLGKGDPASCKAFANSIKSLQELGQAFMDNPVIKQLQTAFTTVSGTFKKVTDLVIAPAFDTLMNVAGGVFNAVKGLATTIWEWGAPVRNTLGAAWDWVKQQLGFGGDGEGGILEWLKTKASEVWEQIKVTFAPVIEPLKKVGTVLLAFSPVGIIAAIVKFVPQLVQSVQWLWAHKDDPNIVKSAHEQMGNTILPQLLSAVQGFSQAVQSTVTSLVNQAVQLSEAVLGLLGAVTGVPLLSAAQSLVQAVSDGVKELVTWGQQSFQAAAQAVQEAFVKIKAKIEPYAGVLSSLALAIVNPAMIPVILAGSAWRMLDDCYKLPIIDFLLDVVIGLLEAAPSLPMFGLLWPMLKAGVLGFLKGVKGQKTDSETGINPKVAITNKLATIISGGSPAFILGFVKGLLKGIWEGLTDPFVLMYEGIKGLGNLISWLNDTANQALSPQPAAQSTATDQTAAASSDAGVDKVAIGQTLQQMGTELQPPAEQVTGGFMPAVQEAFSGGEGLTFEGLMQKLGDAWAAVESAITNAGGQLAQKVCEFMMQDTAEGQMGETVGWLAGTIAFEVALGILTAGSVTAAKGAMKVLKIFAKVLDWTGEALGLAFKGLAKLGGFVLDIVKGIGKLLSNAGGAAKSVLDALGEIGQKLISFADELLGRAAKGAAGEVVEEGAEKAAKETAEAGAEKATKEATEAGAGRSAKVGEPTIEAETTVPTKVGDVDHEVKPRRIGDKIELWVCSKACEAATTKIDNILGELNTLPKTEQVQQLKDELEQLKHQIDEIEPILSTGKKPDEEGFVAHQEVFEKCAHISEKFRELGNRYRSLGGALDEPSLIKEGDDLVPVDLNKHLGDSGLDIGERQIFDATDWRKQFNTSNINPITEIIYVLRDAKSGAIIKSGKTTGRSYIDRFNRYRRAAEKLDLKLQLEVTSVSNLGTNKIQYYEQRLNRGLESEGHLLPWDNFSTRLDRDGPAVPFDDLSSENPKYKTHEWNNEEGYLVEKGSGDVSRTSTKVSARDIKRKQQLIATLTELNGNVKKTAEKFNINPSTVYRWLREYELKIEDFR
ncbi:MAG: DUF4157 domain-containing protein [Coleofasciculus sp. B1-GNL1-01]